MPQPPTRLHQLVQVSLVNEAEFVFKGARDVLLRFHDVVGGDQLVVLDELEKLQGTRGVLLEVHALGGAAILLLQVKVFQLDDVNAEVFLDE